MLGSRGSTGDAGPVLSRLRGGRFVSSSTFPSSAGLPPRSVRDRRARSVRDSARRRARALDVVVFDARRDTEVRSRASTTGGRRAAAAGLRRKKVFRVQRRTRSASAYRDARRALRAGGVAVSVGARPPSARAAAPPAWRLWRTRCARVRRGEVGEDGEGVRECAPRPSGRSFPGFAQETIVLATKTADAERARVSITTDVARLASFNLILPYDGFSRIQVASRHRSSRRFASRSFLFVPRPAVGKIRPVLREPLGNF